VSDGRARLAAACVFPSFPGHTAPDWIRRFLADGGGGIVLFAYNVDDGEQLSALTASLRAERPDLLLALDEEGGDVTRIEWREGSSYPGGAALGALDDPATTEAVARSIAAELAAVGVNWNLAPVADVNVPANPVIGTRAFGSDAELVARHVAAWVRGLQSLRVAACAKHFPGHGSTVLDSHLELPELVGDVADGLPPFRAAIGAGVRSIMTAHVRVSERPATLDPQIVSGLLCDELGFRGVAMADALEMKGVSASLGVEEAAVQALEAGVDALCVGHDLGEETVGAIVAALAARVPEDRLREAASRIAELAGWARPEPGEPDHAAAAAAARRALSVEGDVVLGAAPVVVELRPAANIAAGEAAHRLAGAEVVREGEPLPDADVFVVRDAHRHAWIREAVDGSAAVVVETGLPVWKPPRCRGYIATHGGGAASLRAAEEALGL
jgi:beta-N-acetylhexosaminidase